MRELEDITWNIRDSRAYLNAPRAGVTRSAQAERIGVG